VSWKQLIRWFGAQNVRNAQDIVTLGNAPLRNEPVRRRESGVGDLTGAGYVVRDGIGEDDGLGLADVRAEGDATARRPAGTVPIASADSAPNCQVMDGEDLSWATIRL
jgi:hypothetical protein